MLQKKEYITCLDCGNKKALIIYNPATGKRAGYHCPCMEPGRDKKKNVKPKCASE